MDAEPKWKQYRRRKGTGTLWAKQVPTDFQIDHPKGRLDQRRAGAQSATDLATRTEGKAGDYLVIIDRDTGQQVAWPREAFESLFVPEVSPKTLPRRKTGRT